MNKKKLKEILLLIGSFILWSPLMVGYAIYIPLLIVYSYLEPYLKKLFLFVYGTKESKRRTPLKRISIAVLIIILIIILLEWNWRTDCVWEYYDLYEVDRKQKWCQPLDSKWYHIRTFVLDLF